MYIEIITSERENITRTTVYIACPIFKKYDGSKKFNSERKPILKIRISAIFKACLLKLNSYIQTTEISGQIICPMITFNVN